MELNIIKLIKSLRTQLRKKPKPAKVETIILPKADKPKKSKPAKQAKPKVADIVVHINCKPMTLGEISQKYGLKMKTVEARYRVGNKGNLLIRPTTRKNTEKKQ